MDDAILGEITRCEKKKLEGKIKKRTEENKGEKKNKNKRRIGRKNKLRFSRVGVIFLSWELFCLFNQICHGFNYKV